MSEFRAITQCGTEKDGFDSYSAAEDGVDTHCEFCDSCEDGMGAVIEPVEKETDGGPTVVDEEPTHDTEEVPPEVHEQQTEDGDGYDLPDEGPDVSEDPLTWMPSEFTDEIDGSVAISRKGYSVLAHHYGIEVESYNKVDPTETDFEYAQCSAIATTEDGKQYRAHGSAHVDRGDDPYLLVEMADTRATKRALALATGVGTVAIEELQNEL